MTVFIKTLHLLTVTQQQLQERQVGQERVNFPCHCYLNVTFFGVDN